jgi:hypothetical protein
LFLTLAAGCRPVTSQEVHPVDQGTQRNLLCDLPKSMVDCRSEDEWRIATRAAATGIPGSRRDYPG